MNYLIKAVLLMARKKEDYSYTEKWGPILGQGYFTQIPEILIEHRFELGITPAEWTVLTDLIYRKWTKEHPFPKAKTIGKQNGRSVNTVRRCLRSLEQKGLLKRIRRYNTSNLYSLEPLIKILESYPQRIRKEIQDSSKINTPDYSKMDTYELEPESKAQYSKKSIHSGKLESVMDIATAKLRSP